MRRGGSLFCVVAPLSPLSLPAVAVGKSPPIRSLRRPYFGEWPKSPKEASPAGFEANSEGLTGVPQRGQKLVEACERALAPSLRSFYRTSPLRAFRGGSSRRDREDISPETGFLRLLFFFKEELLGHLVFAPTRYSRVYSRFSFSISFPN